MYEVAYLVDLEGLQNFINSANRNKYQIVGFTESQVGYTVIYKRLI